MKRASLLLSLGILALLSAVQATSITPLNLAQQAKKAQVIVRATIGSATDAKEGDVMYVVYPLTISETVVGNAANLPQAGGKPALFFLQGAQDLPAVTTGTEAFLLLYTGKMDSPVVGFNQGFYAIQNGRVVTAGTASTAAAAIPGPATTDTAPTVPVAASSTTSSTSGEAATVVAGATGSGASTTAVNPEGPSAANTITDPTKLRDAIRAALGGK